jgi:D-alanine transaminase
MKNLAYYNGRITALDEMMIPMNDRSVYFGDGVYDMAYVRNGICFAMQDHIDRFFNSCRLLEIDPGMTKEALTCLLNSLIGKLDRDIKDAMAYFQISRGTAVRKHEFPEPGIPANLLAYLNGFTPQPGKEFRLITAVDTRFAHCNIKSLNLIPNVLATQRAKEAGCDECVLHRDGFVTECAHSSLSVLNGGRLVTTPLSEWILPSITRKHLLQTCREFSVPVDERLYTLDELLHADEIIVTSSLTLFSRVFEIDACPVGGHNLPLFQKLNETYMNRFNRETALKA